MEIIVIEWDDPTYSTVNLTDTEAVAHNYTSRMDIGWLLHESDDRITIAFGRLQCDNDEVSWEHVTTYPKRVIKNLKKVI